MAAPISSCSNITRHTCYRKEQGGTQNHRAAAPSEDKVTQVIRMPVRYMQSSFSQQSVQSQPSQQEDQVFTAIVVGSQEDDSNKALRSNFMTAPTCPPLNTTYLNFYGKRAAKFETRVDKVTKERVQGSQPPVKWQIHTFSSQLQPNQQQVAGPAQQSGKILYKFVNETPTHPCEEEAWSWDDCVEAVQVLNKSGKVLVIPNYIEDMIDYAFDDFYRGRYDNAKAKCLVLLEGEPRHFLNHFQMGKLEALRYELNC